MIEATTSVVCRESTNMALMSGQNDMTAHLGSNPGVSANVSYRQYPFGHELDSNVAFCLKRPSQLWSSWDGTTLNIHPNCCAGAIGSSVYACMTPLCFYSTMFKYWRGDIDVELRIFTSSLVRWRIGIMFVPAMSSMPSTYIGDGSVETYVVDIVGSTTFKFPVRYIYAEPWREIEFPSINPVSGGQIRYFSLTAPTGLTGTTPLPMVEVWVSAGKDFEVALPTTEFMNQLEVAQGEMCKYTFGEDFEDFRLLTKRGCMVMACDAVSMLTYPMDGEPVCGQADTFPDNIETFITFQGWSYDAFLRLAYLGYNGGSVVRVFPTGGAILSFPGAPLLWEVGGLDHVQAANLSTPNASYTPYAEGSTLLRNMPIEFACPSREPKLFKQGRGINNGTVECYCFGVRTTWFKTEDDGITMNVYKSAMDDFTVGGFMCCPRFKYRGIPTGSLATTSGPTRLRRQRAVFNSKTTRDGVEDVSLIKNTENFL